jgi:hypothetical protein
MTRKEKNPERNAEIRRRYFGGESQLALAAAFGLSQVRIHRIIYPEKDNAQRRRRYAEDADYAERTLATSKRWRDRKRGRGA